MIAQTNAAHHIDPSALARSIAGTQPFLRAFISSAVLLAIASMAERVFFGPNFYITLSLHPFWLIVILAALQDGLLVGVAVAGLAALMMDWPPRPIGVDITAHYLSIAILPLQWFLGALVIGLFRDSEIARERRLTAEASELQEVNRSLAAEVRQLDEALERARLHAVVHPSAQAQTQFAMERLLALLAPPPGSMSRTLREAAEMFSAFPVAWYLRPNGPHAEAFSDGLGPEGMEFSVAAGETLLMELEAAQAPLVIASQKLDRTVGAKYLAAAGLCPAGPEHLEGAIVIPAASAAEAEAMARVADLLATLVASGMRKEAVRRPPGLLRVKRYRIANGVGRESFSA